VSASTVGELGEAQAVPARRPAPAPGVRFCGWCDINAHAVPDEPPILYEGEWYHRRGCYQTARLLINGFLPVGTRPVGEAS